MKGVFCERVLSDEQVDIVELIDQFKSATIRELDLVWLAKEIKQRNGRVLLNRSVTNQYLADLFSEHPAFKEMLAGLPNLEINLESYNKVTDEGIISLVENSPQITKLNLKSCTKISDQAISSIVQNCPNLEEIDLSWCDISEKSVFSLANHCPNLKKVGLRSCYVTDRSIEALISNCAQLLSVSLQWCKSTTDVTANAIAGGCPQLENIDIRGCEKITDQGMIRMIESHPKLQSIHFKRCDAVADQVLMAVSRNCPNVRILNLRGCYRSNENRQDNITNTGILQIINSCPLIEQIDFAWHSYLSDEAVIAMAHNWQGFKSADLSGCLKLTDASLIELSKQCKKLKRLILFNYPNITDKSINMLRENEVIVKQY